MKFPTRLHARVAELAAGFFSHRKFVDTVLLVNSCARGTAAAESDLDMAILVSPETSAEMIQDLENAWSRFAPQSETIRQFLEMESTTKVHVDIFNGTFSPKTWDEGGGPDTFEIEIGNRVAHSVPLQGEGGHFQRLQAEWLPYYGRELQQSRIEMVFRACSHDLDEVLRYHNRDLPFQAFDRLYKAFQEFLQGLFISRRTYPVAYNKWIHEQVVEWMELPDLYEDLPQVLSLDDIESETILKKADFLRGLLHRWVKPEILGAPVLETPSE